MYKKLFIFIFSISFMVPAFSMQKESKETTITIDPTTINTVVTDIVSRISNAEKEPKETNLKELLDKITNDKTQLKKKNTCLTVTTGIVAVVAPIVTIVATTLTTSGGTALVEKILDAFGSNCTCY